MAWVLFALLCIVSATSWVVPRDGVLPVMEQQGLVFALAGLAALLFVRGSRVTRVWWKVALAGVGFFGIPVVTAEVARGSVGEISRSALFAMVPVVVVLGMVVADASSGARRLLVPALVGIGGLWLLLPLNFSGTVRGRLMSLLIGAAVVGVGLSSVWLYRLLHGAGLAVGVAVIGLGNAVFLLGCGAVRGELAVSGIASVVSFASGVDLVEVVLLVWLLREMLPVRFAARFLTIPLLTILESYVVMRPQWDVRMVFGTVLLAVGAGALLLLRDVDQEAVLSLR
ncbi:MAG: hypothetical protein M3Y50_09795 [Acidobacteriota bacterium]|nr:hypothetical protein [Acidobacteriota bacterium]